MFQSSWLQKSESKICYSDTFIKGVFFLWDWSGFWLVKFQNSRLTISRVSYKARECVAVQSVSNIAERKPIKVSLHSVMAEQTKHVRVHDICGGRCHQVEILKRKFSACKKAARREMWRDDGATKGRLLWRHINRKLPRNARAIT
jgi:hypothetical protein